MSLWNRLRSAPLVVIVVPMLLVMSGIAPASASTDTMPASPACVITLVSGDPSLAPAPSCFDPSGSDEDEFTVPNYTDANGNRVSYDKGDWNTLSYDRVYSSGGQAQVGLQAWVYDPSLGEYVVGATWTLNYNLEVTAEPTPNTYWVELGKCNHSSGGIPVREATAFVTNGAGADARFIRSVYPSAATLDGATETHDTAEITRVFDGATASTPLITFDLYKPGLETGTTYMVKFWQADVGSAKDWDNKSRILASKVRVYVPSCGGVNGPSTRPRAKISVISCRPASSNVRVELGSKAATKATKYRLVIDPRRGKTFRKTFTTAHKVVKLHRLHRVKKGTLIKVTFGKKVVKKRIRGCGS